MQQYSWIITFSNASEADASLYAKDLCNYFFDAGIRAEQRRDRDYTQDIGTIVVAMLGTAGAVEAMKVIGNWIKSYYGMSINVEVKGFSFKAENLTSKDFEKAMSKLKELMDSTQESNVDRE